MHSIKLVFCAVILVIGNVAQSKAQIGTARSGDVYFSNLTDKEITVVCRSFVDPTGANRDCNARWTFEPREQGYLALKGSRLRAQKIFIRFETKEGSSHWYSEPSDFDSDGDLHWRFTEKDYQTHLGIATRVSEKPPATSTDFDLEDIKEIADTVESVVGAINETNALLEPENKAAADVIVKSISVSSQKSNGDAWDAGGGEPDVFVEIRVGMGIIGDSGKTRTQDDTTFASFNQRLLRVREGDEITVVVFDNDFAANDEIGSYTKTVTKEMLGQGTVEWSFDQVLALRVKFEY
jgi:hypothetical protein